MKIGSKLFLGFLTIMLVFSIGLGFVYVLLLGVEENIKEMDRRAEQALDISEIRSLHRDKFVQLNDYINTSDPEYYEVFNESMVEQEALLKKVETSITRQKELFQAMVEANGKINDIFVNEVVPAVQYGNMSKASEFSSSVMLKERKIIGDAVDRLIAEINRENEQASQESQSRIKFAILVAVVALAASIVAGIVIALYIGRKISVPIKEIQQVSGRIAEGDLSVDAVKVRSKDEIGQLTVSINTMATNIRELIREASEISEKVSASSEELMASSAEMSQGVSQVSATTEELATGASDQAEHASETLTVIQQVDQEIKQISSHANEMADHSQKATLASNHGRQSVNQSIEQMKMIEHKVNMTANIVQSLEEKSNEISQILTVITDISAQTNLLALNAAIEAARAGEHGRGFAIVADEVRKLAEQVADSTNQISAIIQVVQQESQQAAQAMTETIQEVHTGSQIMDENGKSFEEIAHIITGLAAKIEEVARASGEINQQAMRAVQSVEKIAAISEESSAGTEQLAASMEQQNASMQEMNGMAVNLAQMAEQLNHSISKFS